MSALGGKRTSGLARSCPVSGSYLGKAVGQSILKIRVVWIQVDHLARHCFKLSRQFLKKCLRGGMNGTDCLYMAAPRPSFGIDAQAPRTNFGHEAD